MTGSNSRNAAEQAFPRLYNQRPLALMLLFFICGVLCCRQVGAVCAVCYCSAGLIALFLCLFKQIDKRALVVCLLALCLSSSYLGAVKLYEVRTFRSDKTAEVSGRVLSINEKDGTILLDDLSFEGVLYGGMLTLETSCTAQAGDIMSAVGTVNTYSLSEGYQLHMICKGVYYSLAPNDVRVKRHEGAEPRSAFADWVRQGIAEGSNGFTAEYAVSMLFGSGELNEKTKEEYQSLGAAHVFAVSGLHMSVLAGILFFVFSLFKVSKKYSLPLVAVFMFVYCWLCRFSPSVIRAALMTTILLVVQYSGFCPDRLSVFSFTALLSLLVKPYWLFDVSFLLSYLAIFGIYMLYGPFKKLLSKIRMPKKLADALALDCAVCFSLLPMTAFFFEGFSLLSILASLVVIPLASVVFGLFLCAVPLLLVPFLAVIPLTVAKYIVLLISGFVSVLSALELYVPLSVSLAVLPLWYGSMLLLSDYTLLSACNRLKLSGGLFGFTLLAIAA